MKRILYLIMGFFLFFISSSVNATSREDIMSLANSINTCGNFSLVNNLKITYSRMLNERDISDDKLDKIYNNINVVKGILDSYGVCDKSSISKLPKDVKDNLYNLYKQTNNLITSSPRYTDNISNEEEDNNNEEIVDNEDNNEEVKVIIDSSNGEIKVYDNGSLINVVGETVKLNYVGINKKIVYFDIVLVLLLVVIIILKVKYKNNLFITSILYSIIFILGIFIIFNNNISSIIDKIDSMNVNVSDNVKEVVVKDKKIISYPSYGNKYGKIIINDKEDNIYFGDGSDILSRGVGQSSTSSLIGEEGTTIISGHNTGLFGELFNINKNDNIRIETVYGEFIYSVKDINEVVDTDIDSLNKEYDLILYTCSPKSNIYGDKRLVIYLDLVSDRWIGDNNEE